MSLSLPSDPYNDQSRQPSCVKPEHQAIEVCGIVWTPNKSILSRKSKQNLSNTYSK